MLNGMPKLSKALIIISALAITDTLAQSRSLQVGGIAGYLSEWEFSGTVTEINSAGEQEFSGSLIWKHVGLCSVNGPEEKPGKIRLRFSGPGSSPRMDGIISLGDDQCRYSAGGSGRSTGYMDCPAAQGIPISMSID